jgi:3-deoxy-D-manno-octulosonic-acid transferase
MENFTAVVSDFLSSSALIQVKDAAELETALESLLSDKTSRNDYGRRAAAVVKAKQGVLQRSINEISAILRPLPSR